MRRKDAPSCARTWHWPAFEASSVTLACTDGAARKEPVPGPRRRDSRRFWRLGVVRFTRWRPEVGAVLITLAAWFVSAGLQEEEDRDDRDATIAFRWGNGKYGEATYGMRVFEVEGGVDVRATITMGPGSPRWHDCGRIGRAASHEEAVRRFSVISWRVDGVHVGSDIRDEYFLERAIIEANR
jgi:hypothetical protein